MKHIISLLLNGSRVVYELQQEGDDLYIAFLTSKSIYDTSLLPNRVVLIKAASGWKTDIDDTLLSDHLIRELEDILL